MLSKRAFGVVVGLLIAAGQLGAQAWDDPRVLAMVQRATDRRVQQLADSGLTGYQATAHGYVTFLAQVGEGFRELPRVVKADELALEVYWRAPNLSKQRIIGRRDTTLLPTDIRYHQDHLGIVQNNFPATIRLGDGDEVRDVPHPLSVAGLGQYAFALTDSLRITTPGLVIDVYEIKVRPRDDTQPRIVGAVYLDRESAQVVRMAFGFTRPAYVDKQLEDVFVVLENGVVGGRFWLPRRQEVEIRRTLRWLDYPVRGMIRGRWEIGGYELNIEVPPTLFRGPEIVSAPPAVLQQYQWPPGRLTDSLPPELRVATPTEVKRTMDEVRALAGARAASRRIRLMAKGASDVVRFDRNSGLSLGAGVALRVAGPLTLAMQGRYGFSDESRFGTATLTWHTVQGDGISFRFWRDVRGAGDVDERSRLVNSLAAQEFSSDFSDLYGTLGVAVAIDVHRGLTRATVELGAEEARDLGVHATPFRGTFGPSFAPWSNVRTSAVLRVQRPTSSAWFGFDWRARAEACVSVKSMLSLADAGIPDRMNRGLLDLELGRPVGDARISTRTVAVVARGETFLGSQDLAFFGGPVSAPGYAYHSLVGDRAVAHSTEFHLPVPFFAVRLGRFGNTPARATLVPHWSAVGLHAVPATFPILPAPTPAAYRANPTGWYHSAGLALVFGADLIRVDVSRPIPTGRWLLSVDLSRPFWSIM